MASPLSLTLSDGNVVAVTLSAPAERALLTDIATRLLKVQARESVLSRTYHMGSKPTPGKDYDDRLTARLGLCATTCYKYLELPERSGGLRARQVGTKWLVTELACRDWLGDGKEVARAA